MSDKNFFPDIPELDFKFPATPLLLKANEYNYENLPAPTAIHCIRTAYFAAIIASQHPDYKYANLNLEASLYAIIMHDLGQSLNREIVSDDKRWEVDGANVARDFLENNFTSKWDKQVKQLVWDSIVLHTSPSIAIHKEAEVALTQRAIMIDLFGPQFPGNYISQEQFIAVSKLFPRDGFKESMVGALCCACKEKPRTTFDNFCMEFGMTYGYDLQGTGKEEYATMVAENAFAPKLMSALDGLLEWEAKGFPQSSPEQ